MLYNTQKWEKMQTVNFEQAKKLKSLKFNWLTYNHYNLDGELFETTTEKCNWNENELYISAPNISDTLNWMITIKHCRIDALITDEKAHNILLDYFLDKKLN